MVVWTLFKIEIHRLCISDRIGDLVGERRLSRQSTELQDTLTKSHGRITCMTGGRGRRRRFYLGTSWFQVAGARLNRMLIC